MNRKVVVIPGRDLTVIRPCVGLNNRAADGQPHAQSPGTRAEVRVKNPRQTLRIDPFSVVSYAELNAAGIGPFGLDKHGRIKRLRRRDRVERIADQVDQHLLDLYGVARELWQIRCQVESECDAPLADFISEDGLERPRQFGSVRRVRASIHDGSRTYVSAR